MIEFVDCMNGYEDALREWLCIPREMSYRPIGWMRNDLYDMLIDIIGDENIRFVSQMSRRFKEDDNRMYTRATLFVAPAGIVNISNYLSMTDKDMTQ
jgi:hypothetical protein